MKSRTFFLGAGFSKAINPAYPTLHELSKAVVANFLARYSTGPLRECFDQIPQSLAFNVEQLLTYLYSDWPWKASVDKDLDRALYKAFVYEIGHLLRSIQPIKVSDEYRWLIHYMRRRSNNSIVTLNYDGLIEEYRLDEYNGTVGFEGLKIEIEDPFIEGRKTSPEIPWIIEREAPNILKKEQLQNEVLVSRNWVLHATQEDFEGLVAQTSKHQSETKFWIENNYKRIQEQNKSKDFYPVHDLTGIYPITHLGKTIHLHGSLYWKSEEDADTIRITNQDGTTSLTKLPQIVPPVLDKSNHYASGQLRRAWNSAHSVFQNSDEIVVIGFSFPLTDVSCHFLFKSALKANARMVVVNTDPSVKDRYQSIFAEMEVEIDYRYVGEDALTRYIRNEVLAI